MRLLLDTHVFIWAIDTPERLLPATRAAIQDPANDVMVSAATAWEIAIKAGLGRIRFPLDRFAALVTEAGMVALAMTADHAIDAGRLPPHHRDPFDRMLVAQALREQARLLSDNAQIARYDVPVLRAT